MICKYQLRGENGRLTFYYLRKLGMGLGRELYLPNVDMPSRLTYQLGLELSGWFRGAESLQLLTQLKNFKEDCF